MVSCRGPDRRAMATLPRAAAAAAPSPAAALLPLPRAAPRLAGRAAARSAARRLRARGTRAPPLAAARRGWGGVSPRAVLDLPRRREAAEKPAQKVWAAPPIRRLYSGADGWVRDGAWMGRCFGVLHVWMW